MENPAFKVLRVESYSGVPECFVSYLSGPVVN